MLSTTYIHILDRCLIESYRVIKFNLTLLFILYYICNSELNTLYKIPRGHIYMYIGVGIYERWMKISNIFIGIILVVFLCT